MTKISNGLKFGNLWKSKSNLKFCRWNMILQLCTMITYYQKIFCKKKFWSWATSFGLWSSFFENSSFLKSETFVEISAYRSKKLRNFKNLFWNREKSFQRLLKIFFSPTAQILEKLWPCGKTSKQIPPTFSKFSLWCIVQERWIKNL